MKTLSYVNAVTEEIEIGKDYYFGQLFDGEGDGSELLESKAIAVTDEEGEEKVVAFEIKKTNDDDIMGTVVTVTDIY